MSQPAPVLVRKNLLVTATGPTGCGKSRLVWQLFGKKAPRIITFDTEREAIERDPSAIPAEGFSELVEALRYCASRARWHIAYRATIADRVKALDLLSPADGSKRDSLSRALGGVAVMCDELDELAPARGASEGVRGAWKRGRHDLLSIYAATQRPAECARVCTSQSHILVMFQTFEPADLEFARASRGPAVARALRDLPAFHSIYCRRGVSAIEILDPNYKVIRKIHPLAEKFA